MPYLRNKSKIIKIMKTKETKTQLVRVLLELTDLKTRHLEGHFSI